MPAFFIKGDCFMMSQVEARSLLIFYHSDSSNFNWMQQENLPLFVLSINNQELFGPTAKTNPMLIAKELGIKHANKAVAIADTKGNRNLLNSIYQRYANKHCVDITWSIHDYEKYKGEDEARGKSIVAFYNDFLYPPKDGMPDIEKELAVSYFIVEKGEISGDLIRTFIALLHKERIRPQYWIYVEGNEEIKQKIIASHRRYLDNRAT